MAEGRSPAAPVHPPPTTALVPVSVLGGGVAILAMRAP
jgi:hypothetical protein